MLFMVIERFQNGDFKAVRQRFQDQGRMLPENVLYHASWINAETATCYQVMEAPDRESLQPWIDAWRDLVDFEVVPVETSAEFWRTLTT